LFPVVRRTPAAEDLELTHEHEAVARPRRGDDIDWADFDRAAYPEAAVREAAEAWRERARQEFCSLALFTEIAYRLHALGAPLDWSGAFVRMTGDEVRHTELCARMAEALGAPAPASVDEREIHLPVPAGTSLRAYVRETIVAAFCIGETLSGRMFRRCLRLADVPLARQVVHAIVDDETFHGRFGWEAAALLMRDIPAAERDALARSLPALFRHYRHICCAGPGEAWARAPASAEAPSDPNFGTLTREGYARAFFDGMTEDVVPGLCAIGLPEAEDAWRAARC
jgi:hypothetical protein